MHAFRVPTVGRHPLELRYRLLLAIGAAAGDGKSGQIYWKRPGLNVAPLSTRHLPSRGPKPYAGSMIAHCVIQPIRSMDTIRTGVNHDDLDHCL